MDAKLMERQHEYVGTTNQIWMLVFYFIFKGYRRLIPSILTCYYKEFLSFENLKHIKRWMCSNGSHRWGSRLVP